MAFISWATLSLRQWFLQKEATILQSEHKKDRVRQPFCNSKVWSWNR